MPKGISKINIARIATIMVAFAFYQPANAFTIDSSTQTGDTFDVSWELLGGADGSLNTGGATFEILGITDTVIGFELTLSNTTAPSQSANIGLDAFGFGTDQDFTVVAWGGEPVANVSGVNSSGNPIPGVSDRFVATPTGGLAPGDTTGPFTFGLRPPDVIDLDRNPVTFSPLEDIYGPMDDSGTGPVARTSSNDPQSLRAAIPVPGTLFLVGAGLLLARRRFKTSA